MKKLLFMLLFTTLSFATKNVVVTIVPQKIFIEKIAGDKLHVTVMVQEGASPHNYSPKPSQMRKITKANIYFTIGVEFEKIWLKKFQNQNKNMIIVSMSKGIKKEHVGEEEQCQHTAHTHNKHSHEKEVLDPHVWVDPINVKIMAQNIYEALILIDKNNEAYYKKNLDNYLKELDILNEEIKEILKGSSKGTIFMVFHPSWGYFAKRYNLKQLPIEVEGKEPKMKALIQIIKKAKKENVHAIFTQPEFSDKASQNIAKHLKIEVIKASPLAKNWAENLKNLAKAIAKKEK